jgi:hypothetical protein
MTIDVNIAALIRDNVTTISVKFPPERGEMQSDKGYTYVSRFMDHKPGDWVIVPATNQSRIVYKMVQIESVDATVQIDVGSTIKYKWVVCKVDFEEYESDMQRNLILEKTIARGYAAKLKKSFREQFMSQLEDGDELHKLLK